jgi:hypothetical protein
MSVEVMDPFNTQSIVSPVLWEALIPAGLVELARQDHEQWNTPARRVDRLNRRNPLTIAWLNDSSSTSGVRAGDYF